MPCFYLEPNQREALELQACIAEALYDIESILVDPRAYSDEQLCELHEQTVSNLERAWRITGGSEDQYWWRFHRSLREDSETSFRLRMDPYTWRPDEIWQRRRRESRLSAVD